MAPNAGPMPPITPFPWWDVIIILLLVTLNGVFSMSELALVSARKARLEAMARAKRRGAQTALLLAGDPGKLLPTVQIGITGIGVLAGAYSGASLGKPVSERLHLLGVPAGSADDFGFALVIVLTTYASLTIGELIPKQFALRSPEPIACVAAVPMMWLSRATAPLVWLLDQTTRLAFRIIGLSRQSDSQVTAEELHLIVAEASNAGVIEESERAIISGVVRLADRPVREVMTPRTEVAWIDADADEAELRDAMADMAHSRLPVADGSVDNIIGVITARDVVAALIAGRPCDPRALMRSAPVVPDQMDAMNALEVLRSSEVPMVLVHDEYGHFEGIVTPADLLAAIAGSFVSNQDDAHDPPLHEREDGSWLVSGSFAADMLAEKLGFDLEEDRDYATVAGLALAIFKRLPNVGDKFDYDGWSFEIVDMDGRKIDKLLATRNAA